MIIFYVNKEFKQGRELMAKVCNSLGHYRFDVYDDPVSLEAILRSGLPSINRLAVLVPGDMEELESLSHLKGLLASLRLILILPDNLPDTIAFGHMMKPRFLDFIDSDPEILIEVADRMAYMPIETVA